MRELDDEIFRTVEELGIDLQRPERGVTTKKTLPRCRCAPGGARLRPREDKRE